MKWGPVERGLLVCRRCKMWRSPCCLCYKYLTMDSLAWIDPDDNRLQLEAVSQDTEKD